MPSERIQRRLDRLLDEAEAAADRKEWSVVGDLAREALALDPGNGDAAALSRAAEANLVATSHLPVLGDESSSQGTPAPSSFAAGRYQVVRFLGEGGRKRVFLAHDAVLDRDVAFALIKTDGLDEVGRQRIVREAQAMGRMGAHPHLVSIFDLGEEGGAPYVVTELLEGGDVEGELARAGGALELPRALDITKGVARGLAFVHQRGIVHRDLKPGNVWLSADGVPKIGDFGLAVAQGRSRLTQHGLMVGTYAYMPPEQALGAEATPRSDLYSLGCLLYELVTGHPPFEGDSATSVISQHLNTRPVAPSWHTQHCPPALEDLILALLAKEPGGRPASASDVLAILESVDPAERSRSHSSESANPLDALARGVFVGRDRELEVLRATLDGALAGRGAVAMLVGEPGIGKTRTVQELETYARMRGAKVLWGRAHESSGAPPYWPWVQIARAYRDTTPEDVRRRQYQPYAVELQRIFPGLRDLFPNLPDPPPETEEGQFRLFDTFAAFAQSVATETPLVFVLDDLHWADRATLQLLSYLAREIGGARILVLGTYRDTDLDRRHPLAQTLAELNREDLFTRVGLRGLSPQETSDYVRRASGNQPSRELLARIHDETEGNPFFMSEIVNLMTQEGTLNSSVSGVRIPEGVREALGRRLDRLSDDANGLLTTLAVAGREFELLLVGELSEFDDNSTLRFLEEALRARVLEETAPGRYRFVHALMQETLLGELSAARRVLLHGQIAEVLERLYGGSREYVPAIAEHYRESALLNSAHRKKAVRYLREAADQAVAAFAYAQAAPLYESSLDLAAPHSGEDLAPVWAELSVSRLVGLGSDGTGPAIEAIRRAARAAKSVETRAAALARFGEYALQPHWVMVGSALEEALNELGDASTRDACWLYAIRSNLDFSEAGDASWERAKELATALDLRGLDVPADLLVRPSRKLIEEGQFVAAYEGARRTYDDARAVGYRTTAPLAPMVLAACYAGLVEEYLGAISGDMEHLRRIGHVAQADAFYWWSAALAWRRGETDRARSLSESARSDRPWIRAGWLIEEGRADELARAALPQPLLADLGIAARAAVVSGSPRAAGLFEDWERAYREVGPLLFDQSNWLARIGEALYDLGAEPLLRDVYAYLERFPQMRNWRDGITPDHMRGAIALRLGHVEDAERHFRTGHEWASRPEVRCVLDAGRCHQGLAEVAERRGQHLEAMQHLDAAGELFATHGAKLYLDQVIAEKQVLGA